MARIAAVVILYHPDETLAKNIHPVILPMTYLPAYPDARK